MLITLYKIGGVLFRLLATNGFRVKAKKERFTAASSRCRQNLKYENFPSSSGRLRQNIAPKSVLHVQHDYFSSFNQSNHWFVALSLTLPSSDLKLPRNFLVASSVYVQNLWIWIYDVISYVNALFLVASEGQNPEVSISLMWPWPITWRYYLN